MIINNLPNIYLGNLTENFYASQYRKLNQQVQNLGYDFNFKFSQSERQEYYSKIKGNIGFNYDVQAELALISSRCSENDLVLVIYYLLDTEDGSIYLEIEKDNCTKASKTENYIKYVFNDLDDCLLTEIYIHFLAFSMGIKQRDFLSGKCCMDYDLVDGHLVNSQFKQQDFLLSLIKKEDHFLSDADWFQILIKDEKDNLYLKIASQAGKRTYATIWLNQNDIKLLTCYIPKALDLREKRKEESLLFLMKLFTEQKRGNVEYLAVPIVQLNELIASIRICLPQLSSMSSTSFRFW